MYIVRPSDSMTKIAAAHEVTLGALVRANPQIEDPGILEYHASVTGGFDENEVPWCSSFARSWPPRS